LGNLIAHGVCFGVGLDGKGPGLEVLYVYLGSQRSGQAPFLQQPGDFPFDGFTNPVLVVPFKSVKHQFFDMQFDVGSHKGRGTQSMIKWFL
jgi:hypothetical protein